MLVLGLDLSDFTRFHFLVLDVPLNTRRLECLRVDHVSLQLFVRLRNGLGLFIFQPLVPTLLLELVFVLLANVLMIPHVLLLLVLLTLFFERDGRGDLTLEVIEQVPGRLLPITSLLLILFG